MGLGQSKQYRFNREPRYPINFQPYQQPQPFIPGYIPVNYAQPMYPQQGFIPPMYGQGAVIQPQQPQQVHYYEEEEERPKKRKTRRRTRADTNRGRFIPPRDQPSPQEAAPRRAHSGSHRPRETVVAPVVPERNQSRRVPTPFIPRMVEADEEEEEADRPRGERERPASRQSRRSPIHYEPPITVRGDLSALVEPVPPATRRAYDPSGPKLPLRNPLPPPPIDLYEMSPFKSLSTLPQTTALLQAYKPQQNTFTVTPFGPNGNLEKKKSIFRAFSKKKQPERVFVYAPASSQQPQHPSNQPQHSAVHRSSSTQPRQSEARSQTQPRFQSQQRPFAGAGPNDIPTPTTAEPTTGGTYQTETQSDSSSVSSSVLSLPIPPHPTNPPTIKFDQSRSYTQFMNHSPHRVVYNGLEYPTALHLHEALKFLGHRPDIAEKIRQCSSVHEVYPLATKYAGLQRPDWGEQFLQLMEEVLHSKFRQHPDLRIMLLGTGNADLEYADFDDYWGSGPDGQGANQLGKVLTRVREQLREDSTP